ncbi:MAG: helicase-related protein, partial [Aquiluna sp.]
TKRLAEEVTEYVTEMGIRVRYLHSDVDTLRRVELLRELRQGIFDVLVGINLLREGLDLPEVSLVAILDADKEGFLRSTTSLIQTIGRAARNVSGEVHMYADTVTQSMRRAIDETERRRAKQLDYNKVNGIDPQPLRKKIADITDALVREEMDTETMMEQLSKQPARKVSSTPMRGRKDVAKAGRDQLLATIVDLDAQMRSAAAQLNFELAARIRDEIAELKREVRNLENAGHA